jgi:hypothetical protein
MDWWLLGLTVVSAAAAVVAAITGIVSVRQGKRAFAHAVTHAPAPLIEFDWDKSRNFVGNIGPTQYMVTRVGVFNRGDSPAWDLKLFCSSYFDEAQIYEARSQLAADDRGWFVSVPLVKLAQEQHVGQMVLVRTSDSQEPVPFTVTVSWRNTGSKERQTHTEQGVYE